MEKRADSSSLSVPGKVVVKDSRRLYCSVYGCLLKCRLHPATCKQRSSEFVFSCGSQASRSWDCEVRPLRGCACLRLTLLRALDLAGLSM